MVCDNCISHRRNNLIGNLRELVKKGRLSEQEEKILLSILLSTMIETEIEYSLNKNLIQPLSKSLKNDLGRIVTRL